MSGDRILILSSSHLAQNPRTYKEAMTLAEAGYLVTVMSVSASPRLEAIDRELMRSAPFARATLDLTEGSIVRRLRTWIARKLCRHLRVESVQSLGPAADLLGMAEKHQAELTILHTELPLCAGRRLAARGRRFSADLEDWYSEDLLPEDRAGRPLRLLRDAERFALHHAAYVSTTSASLARALAERYSAAAPLVLRNVFPLQPTCSPAVIPEGRRVSMVWFSQTIGTGRGLEGFLDAWSTAEGNSEVCLIGNARPGYENELRHRLPEAKRPLLHFQPAVPPSELPARLAEFDVGLALEPSQPANKDLTISNKLLQYLNAGLAVVATSTAGQREVLQSAPALGILVNENQPGDYARKLSAFLQDSPGLSAAKSAARRAAETELCWEREAPKLLEAVRSSLSRTHSQPV